ncbi:Crp/Fnr family transcriptional regulator [Dinghuibacter silviterrae]|uniref:CRP-like cAMP-binding protein n=1 Tax=Dinghuibacter silviterrae TaxID=1539049 RepID=A0A4R8DR55_9BACT|nr:Crp/Fnr family transcriptional regulator [Dinghuibacter silviterrae]TDX00306.1 CRP-like cAMP-binding protein [Dinghuibacter silviterrae]
MAEQLSADARFLLTEAGDTRTWEKGAFLLREGSVCRHVHGIWKGSVRMFQLQDGKEVNLRFFFVNGFATDFKSLRLGEPSGCFLQAMESTTTLTIDAAALRALYDRSPELERWGRGLLENLVIKEQEHADFFKLFSPEERYDWLLRHDPEVIRKVSGTRLASYIGVSRESLSRIRSRMR